MFPMTKDLENFLNDKITDYSQIGKHAGRRDITVGKNLDNLAAISVGLASRDDVRALSYGEVLISETINYRTQRPERGGLFCEQIFGPRKNYECACGKYKRIRYKGVVCERCGVEVTTSQVRRQRTGHIELAAPVAHIWYLKSVPSRIGLMLDISVKKLEQVIYFASYIVTDVYEDKREEAIKELENAYKNQKISFQKELQSIMNDLTLKLESKEISKKEFGELETMHTRKLDELETEYAKLRDLLKGLVEATVIGELDYRILYEKFPHVFKGGTGAEYLKVLLERIELKEFIAREQAELRIAPKTKQKKILQKLKLASSLFKSGQRPENFILHALQILPPDLRPMIQLDGGRFASSDLNDLYRRVINRNNRLRKLSELCAPEVILKNEKRMLQEAVDMLLNGDVRSNRPGYTTASKKKLKSLADILKGKQGRFRQNLLGKRVDYSGRSVIVVGPELEMNECGLPKTMALTLFKPFVIGRLIARELAYNVKHAEKIIEERTKEVWDTLDEVIAGKYVLLNRAPTLHRLGIQAFRPVLIDGKAIRLHPLCCTAFNADFDGDQMAVHLPLTIEAQNEAANLMVTSKNMLNPSNGEPIVAPSQDMILGCYYLTKIDAGDSKLAFASGEDALSAYENGVITLHTPIKLRIEGKILDTTYGRFLFNEILPEELGFVNETVGK
jgi:DNA-directed RNA polymerase subunit beta'